MNPIVTLVILNFFGVQHMYFRGNETTTSLPNVKLKWVIPISSSRDPLHPCDPEAPKFIITIIRTPPRVKIITKLYNISKGV